MIYLLDKTMRVIKLIRKTHFNSAVQTKELNGLYTLNLELSAHYFDAQENKTYNYVEDFKNATYAGHMDLKNRFQIYKIHSCSVQNSILTVECVHKFFDDAKFGDVIRDKRLHDRTIDYAVEVAFNDIGWKLNEVDTFPEKSVTFFYLSPAECRKKIVETWNAEFDFSFTLIGNKVVKQNIDVKKKLGTYSGLRFYYGNNILNIKYEQDYSEIVTAIIGRGKGEEVGNGYGRRIEFKDIAWEKDGIKKPVGQDYIEILSATQEWGYRDDKGLVKPRIGVVEFPDITDKVELANETYKYLLANCVPKVVYSTTISKLDKPVELGDEVAIIYKKIGLLRKARIQKITVNLLNTDDTKVLLGDYAYFKGDKTTKSITTALEQSQSEFSNYIYMLKENFDNDFKTETDKIKDEIMHIQNKAQSDVEIVDAKFTNEFQTTKQKFLSDMEAARQNNTSQLTELDQRITSQINTKLADTKTYLDQELDKDRNQFATKLLGSHVVNPNLLKGTAQYTEPFNHDEILRLGKTLEGQLWSTDIENGQRSFATFQDVEVEPDTDYTLSFETFSDKQAGHAYVPILKLVSKGVKANPDILLNSDNRYIAVTHKKTRESITFNSKDAHWIRIQLTSGDAAFPVNISKVKLEKGNIATGYVENSNDATDIAQSLFSAQLNDAKAQVIQQANQATDTKIATAKQEIDNTSSEKVKTLNQKVDSLKFVAANMMKGTRNFNEPFDKYYLNNHSKVIDDVIYSMDFDSNNANPNWKVFQIVEVEPNTDYVLSYDALAANGAGIAYTPIMILKDDATEYSPQQWIATGETYQSVTNQKSRLIYKFNSGKAKYIKVIFTFKAGNAGNQVYIARPQLEKGTVAHEWCPNLEDIESEVRIVADSITAKSIEAVRGDIAYLRSNILTANSITSDKLLVDNAMIDKLYANQLLSNKISTDALNAVRANINDLRARMLTSNTIQADMLNVSDAMIDKLLTNNLMAEKIKAKSLEAVYANVGEVRAHLITSESISGDSIWINWGFIDRLISHQLFVSTLTAKSAFISAIKAIDIDASRIRTGVLQSRNGDIRWDMDNSNLHFYNSAYIQFHTLFNALTYRNNGKVAYINFTQTSGTTDPAIVVGANRANSLDPNLPTFSGLIVHCATDSIHLVGDTIRFQNNNIGEKSGGWEMTTYEDTNYRVFKGSYTKNYKYDLGYSDAKFNSVWTNGLNDSLRVNNYSNGRGAITSMNAVHGIEMGNDGFYIVYAKRKYSIQDLLNGKRWKV